MKGSKVLYLVILLTVSSTILPFFAIADSLPVKNVVTNSATRDVLAEHSEWIYLKDKTTGRWQRLIPGICPQWHPDGKRFFYFLDVGYDGGRAELWQADADGESRVRLTRSDYFVHQSPVVSKDGQKLAYHYWTCRASGDFRDIVVIELKGLEDAGQAKVMLRTKEEVDSRSLRWIGENKLEVVVNGKKTGINTSGKGKEQLP